MKYLLIKKFIIILLIINLLFFIVIKNDKQLSILIISIVIMLLTYKLKNEKKNIMLFYFSACNFLYNTGISLVQILKKENRIQGTFFTDYKIFSFETTEFIYKILLIHSLGILLGIIIIFFLRPIKEKLNKFEQESNVIKCFYYILLIMIPYIILKNLEHIILVSKIGYANSYLMIKNKDIDYYIITVYNYIFLIYLSLADKNKKRCKLILVCYLGTNFLLSFSGSRSIFLINLIFSIWYLEVKNYFKLKKRYILILIFLIFLYSSKIVSLRENYGKNDFNDIKKVKILEMSVNFLESQTMTASIIGYLNDFPEIINNENDGKMLLHFFYTFYDSFFNKERLRKSKSEMIGKKASNFSRISYIVNSEYVKLGNGLGGNYIVEMYEMGKLKGVFILSFLFVLIIYFLENLFLRNKSIYINLFVLLIFQNIFMAPRSYYLDFNIRKYLWLCVVYFILNSIMKKIKIKYKGGNI